MFDTKKYSDGHWMKGKDIPWGQTLAVTIADGGEHTFPKTGETKAFLEFSDNHQGLILNKTRVTALRVMFGDDSNQYIGKRIGLRQGPPFQGQPSIDIVQAPGVAVATQPPAPGGREYGDDEAPAPEAEPTW